MNWKRMSWIALIVLVACIVVLFKRETLFARTLPGIACQVLAVLLMVWARLSFGRRSFHAGADPTEGGLVTHGAYRWFRHPIYAAICYFLLVSLVEHASLLTLGLVLTGYLASAVRIAGEESLLLRRYPEYAAYAKRTKRIIPYVF